MNKLNNTCKSTLTFLNTDSGGSCYIKYPTISAFLLSGAVFTSCMQWTDTDIAVYTIITLTAILTWTFCTVICISIT